MTSSMSGSWMDRSATSYDAATAATSGAADASAGNAQPLTRSLDPAGRRAGDLDRRTLVDQVDDQGPGRAAALVQPGQVAVVHRRAVVDDDHAVAERLDVLEVVRGQQQRRAALLR